MGYLLLEIANFSEKERIESYEHSRNCRKKWIINYGKLDWGIIISVVAVLCKCMKFITTEIYFIYFIRWSLFYYTKTVQQNLCYYKILLCCVMMTKGIKAAPNTLFSCRYLGTRMSICQSISQEVFAK